MSKTKYTITDDGKESFFVDGKFFNNIHALSYNYTLQRLDTALHMIPKLIEAEQQYNTFDCTTLVKNLKKAQNIIGSWGCEYVLISDDYEYIKQDSASWDEFFIGWAKSLNKP